MNIRLLGFAATLTLLLPYTAGVNSQGHSTGQDVAVTSEEPNVDHTITGAGLEEPNVDHNVTGAGSEEHKVDHNAASADSEEHNTEPNIAAANTEESETENNVDGASTGQYVVDQKNKTFSINEITVSVGDKIEFVNSDSYFHNVYSLSEAAQFDLGSYPKGDSRTITLDKVGKIVAQCAIHPRMRLDITVEGK